ncbi:MAG: hypothetical protein M3R04_08600, partial [bacterium]|nr:hypothetical protein [bacterium]
FALSLVLLLVAFFKADRMLTQVALWITVASALLSWAAMLTGPGAVEGLSSFAHNHPAMTAHARFGKLTTYASLLCGVVALAVIWSSGSRQAKLRPWLAMLVILVAGTNVMLTATATLGGAITHKEIADDAFSRMVGGWFGLKAPGSEKEDDHDAAQDHHH